MQKLPLIMRQIVYIIILVVSAFLILRGLFVLTEGVATVIRAILIIFGVWLGIRSMDIWIAQPAINFLFPELKKVKKK